jgi:hypothetical protein
MAYIFRSISWQDIVEENTRDETVASMYNHQETQNVINNSSFYHVLTFHIYDTCSGSGTGSTQHREYNRGAT